MCVFILFSLLFQQQAVEEGRSEGRGGVYRLELRPNPMQERSGVSVSRHLYVRLKQNSVCVCVCEPLW